MYVNTKNIFSIFSTSEEERLITRRAVSRNQSTLDNLFVNEETDCSHTQLNENNVENELIDASSNTINGFKY
jgi:hypothetical protein